MILLTNEVSNYLRGVGYDVTVGFNAEATSSLYATGRCNESNRMCDLNPNGINLHVCIHSNSGTPSIQTVFGPEICYQNSNHNNHLKSKNFAETVYNKLFLLYQKSFPSTKKRFGDGLVEGTGYYDFQELRETKATSIYVETAFHDNLEDAHWIIDNSTAIAKAIGEGIIDYINSL